MIGNLPDWLSVVVALVGLTGGPAGGVYLGGMSRARLDDRREIVDRLLPYLRQLGMSFHGYQPRFLSDLRSLSAESSVIFVLDEVGAIVQRLPVHDRWLYVNLIEAVVLHDPRTLRADVNDHDGWSTAGVLIELFEDVESEKARSAARQLFGSTARGGQFPDNTDYQAALSAFEDNLFDAINPVFIRSRFRRWRSWTSMALRGRSAFRKASRRAVNVKTIAVKAQRGLLDSDS